MIGHLINDPVWRRKNRAVTFISAIPAFGWMALLFMGERSGQKSFRRAGKIFGWLSMIAWVLTLIGDRLGNVLYSVWTKNLTGAMGGAIMRAVRQACSSGWTILIPLWIICFIYTMIKADAYLKYLALKEAGQPPRNPLVHDKAWRFRNLSWLVWAWLPGLGGLSLYRAGYASNGKKLRAGGVVAIVLTLLMALITNILSNNSFLALSGNGLKQFVITLANTIAGSLWPACLLLSYGCRERVLDALAIRWDADTRQYPLLSDKKWRRANRNWRVWNWVPVVGGIGIALAGLQGRNRKYTVKGVIACVCSAVLFLLSATRTAIVSLLRESNAQDLATTINRLLPDVVSYLSILLYCVVLSYGAMICWDVLRAKAASLQGYSSEFERELDMQTRMRARKIDFTSVPVQPEPTPEVKPAARMEIPQAPEVRFEQPEPVAAAVATAAPVAPAAPAAPVDINHGTQAELMTLPGIGVVQAKQAMEYRAANGGFKSVDEFVEVLKIKPHFAVQIFARATLGQAAAAENRSAASSSAPRRRIDF